MKSTKSSRSAGYSPRQPSYNKFGNKKTEVDGILFHSLKESRRYSELKILERAKVIKDLNLQVKFPLVINDILVCNYIADFTYYENNSYVVEDCKGMRTDTYKLKKKLMRAVRQIDIFET